MARRTDWSRREFLSGSAAAAGALTLGAYVNPAAAQVSKSPNERLRIAGVGTTGRAGADLGELSSQDIVALADVDDNLMAKGSAKYPEARKYREELAAAYDDVGRPVEAAALRVALARSSN